SKHGILQATTRWNRQINGSGAYEEQPWISSKARFRTLRPWNSRRRAYPRLQQANLLDPLIAVCRPSKNGRLHSTTNAKRPEEISRRLPGYCGGRHGRIIVPSFL